MNDMRMRDQVQRAKRFVIKIASTVCKVGVLQGVFVKILDLISNIKIF